MKQRCEWCDYEGEEETEVGLLPDLKGQVRWQCVDVPQCDERQQVNARREEKRQQAVLDSQQGGENE